MLDQVSGEGGRVPERKTRRRVAVVLFNLGGPDRPEAVRPFLFNLFNDPAIIRVPNPFRLMLAYLISSRRAKPATAIYARIGGKSPLLENTRAQADALDAALADEGDDVRCFIAMRYWHPMSLETAQMVKGYDPHLVIMLPLYPQYSTTTSASSVKAWMEAAKAVGLSVPHRSICCYPDAPGFIEAMADPIRKAYGEAAAHGRPRVLFSAHGLPKKVITAGDPYQWQCEQTAEALVRALGIDGLDWVSCYQSRVGPMEWIGPSTDAEIKRAAADKVPVIIVPIAFVSEHSETLVEIEIEYREMAHELGVPHFIRIPTVGTDPRFIGALADLVRPVLAAVDPRKVAVPPPPPPTACSSRGGGCCS